MDVNIVHTNRALDRTIRSEMKYTHIIKLTLLLFFAISCEKDNNFDPRDEYRGIWLVNENSSMLGQRAYEIIIKKDSFNINGLNFYNFYKIGTEQKVFGTISTQNISKLTIAKQLVKNNILEGFGDIKRNELNLTCFINDGNEIDTVNAKFTR